MWFDGRVIDHVFTHVKTCFELFVTIRTCKCYGTVKSGSVPLELVLSTKPIPTFIAKDSVAFIMNSSNVFSHGCLGMG